MASRKLILDLERETGRQLQAGCHPVRFAGQQLGNSAHRQVIVLGQRLHHPRFIERGDRSSGRVGQEHESFVVDGAQRALDDRGYVRVSGLAPPEELLEPVEDLVVAVVRGHDPQRRVGQLGSVHSKVPRPEGGVARTDELDGKVADGTWEFVPRRRRG